MIIHSTRCTQCDKVSTLVSIFRDERLCQPCLTVALDQIKKHREAVSLPTDLVEAVKERGDQNIDGPSIIPYGVEDARDIAPDDEDDHNDTNAAGGEVIAQWHDGEIVTDGDGVGYYIRIPDGYGGESFFFGADEAPEMILGLLKVIEHRYTGEHNAKDQV